MRRWRRILAAYLCTTASAFAQTPREIVAAAVQSELEADRSDHAAFEYHDHDVQPGRDAVFLVIETPVGSLRRKLLDHDRPLTAEEQHVEDLRIHAFVDDVSLQQKQKRDDARDDAQAESLLKLLPVAFLWTERAKKTSFITLAYRPDPAFHPSTMEARVLSAMSGEVVVADDKGRSRIQKISGSLTSDVKIGFGVLGRLRAGGTFSVERREVVPGHWQITESHVHIDGRALLFKSIGEQEDETKTAFRLSPATTLQGASDALKVAR